MKRTAVLTFGLLALAGCARALREPPSLEDLAGGAITLTSAEADAYLERAEALYEQRTLETVREAAEIWSIVAQGAPERGAAIKGAVRSRIWLADHEKGAAKRRHASVAAVQTGQHCRRLFPEDPECRYWLGAALGLQARERRTTALDALPKIVELFETAAAEAPLLDEAGPDRALALVYVRAPGWPSGPGDPDLGLEHARRAVELRPSFPPNHLALGEALEAVEEVEEARKAYRRALDLAREREAEGGVEADEWMSKATAAVERTGSH